MKTFKSVGLLLTSLLSATVLLTVSCSKADNRVSEESDSTQTINYIKFPARSSEEIVTANRTESNSSSAPLSFCNEKTVFLCSTNANYGNLTIKRASDGNIHATFTSGGSWYLAYVSLYTGNVAGIPMRLADLPHRKTFTLPFNQQSHSFVVAGQPSSFIAIGYVILVKKNSFGLPVDLKTIYADGCHGTVINVVGSVASGNNNGGYEEYYGGHSRNDGCGDDDHSNNDDDDDDGKGKGKDKDKDKGDDDDDDGRGNGNGNGGGNGGGGNTGTVKSELNGGKYFNYTGDVCAPAVIDVVMEEPDICSRPIMTFFGVHPVYNTTIPWPCADVVVGGHKYTEAEGRAISGGNENSGSADNARYVLLRVATLKLSYTEYELSPTLKPAVATIETWLKTKGKISPAHMPTGTQAVKEAALKISEWIDTHNCPERR